MALRRQVVIDELPVVVPRTPPRRLPHVTLSRDLSTRHGPGHAALLGSTLSSSRGDCSVRDMAADASLG